MGVANVPATAAGGVEPKYQKFTSSGTFTLPAGYGPAKPLLVNVLVIGGGGGGAWADVINAIYGNYTFNQPFFPGPSSGDWANKPTGYANLTWANKTVGAGGSGGLAATQMYLTENLAVTVGAKGTRGSSILTANAGAPLTTSGSFPGNTNGTWSVSYGLDSSLGRGNAGGTSTAGAVSASGGSFYNANYDYQINVGYSNTPTSQSLSFSQTGMSGTTAAGGQPAGTAADTSPLIGAIAGGSSNTTPIYGSTGVGGIKGDGSTSTGVDGTGGGQYSDGASGAVIFTWWE